MSRTFEARLPGENTPHDTRAEANAAVDRQKRYRQILCCLEQNGPMTAKELSVALWESGQLPTAERNFTAPRLTELSDNGVVEPVGKKRCQYTGKTVSVYAIREG